VSLCCDLGVAEDLRCNWKLSTKKRRVDCGNSMQVEERVKTWSKRDTGMLDTRCLGLGEVEKERERMLDD
jgi:hypothetical protein